MPEDKKSLSIVISYISYFNFDESFEKVKVKPRSMHE